MSTPEESVPIAVAKVVAVGAAAGYAWIEVASKWAQFGAAAVAIIFGLVQTFFLLRDKWWRERK